MHKIVSDPDELRECFEIVKSQHAYYHCSGCNDDKISFNLGDAEIPVVEVSLDKEICLRLFREVMQDDSWVCLSIGNFRSIDGCEAFQTQFRFSRPMKWCLIV